MEQEFSKDFCVRLLVEKHKEINGICFVRYPRRSDFTDEEVCAIKAFLGPWPRALEIAGLKNPNINK